ncbi:hypothetical protein [Actinoplanes aureus]|uniref:Uncharacterized protein n=1 Tax=Actinoplanes aureus TaxID=2792083 RepID=A0A931G0Q4_9ACTN|nr:hypothetical protein [Actinoplanes aureus]MBG0564301.1 hypothetical protein [Actinoplanes aureus]
MTYPADSPVNAVRVERAGDHFRILLRRADGRMDVIQPASVRSGLRTPGDVLVELLAHGVPEEDAAHCVSEVEPGFDARAELERRSPVAAEVKFRRERSRS